MSTLSIVTPSFGPDFELCRDLHDSVLRFAPSSVVHQIIVPKRDLDQFSALAGPRCTVTPINDILPRSMWRLPQLNMWLNTRRPYPPVRGWIAQQLVKMIAAAACDDKVVLLADSDLVFIRPFGAETYLSGDAARFYRKPDAIDVDTLPRHVAWHDVSRQLLGIKHVPPMPLPDYICWPMAWDPDILRQLTRRVESVTGHQWIDAIGSRLHFSEGILYGVFVDEVLRDIPGTDAMLCHQHTGEPLDLDSLREFLSGVEPDEVCVMVSAKSDTPLSVRRQAFGEFFAAREPS